MHANRTRTCSFHENTEHERPRTHFTNEILNTNENEHSFFGKRRTRTNSCTFIPDEDSENCMEKKIWCRLVTRNRKFVICGQIKEFQVCGKPVGIFLYPHHVSKMTYR